MADKKDLVELAVYQGGRALLFDAVADKPFVVVDGYEPSAKTKDFFESGVLRFSRIADKK